eukprot:CAMPEP_0181522724 /NCGR_PEP_ID=MMETSP1110-20121109/67528_1 /TAXON_ID=174948 /ORGANISM="Symbiodinium sp., Strain CCMP421" /LENGTH=33 /DNA_ID= /DNA_START= /DNA_END= /DNA_ORIENTATION=
MRKRLAVVDAAESIDVANFHMRRARRDCAAPAC